MDEILFIAYIYAIPLPDLRASNRGSALESLKTSRDQNIWF